MTAADRPACHVPSLAAALSDTHLASRRLEIPCLESCGAALGCYAQHCYIVQDADVVGADFLGQAVLPVADIMDGQVHNLWMDLTDATGAPMQGKDLSGWVGWGCGGVVGGRDGGRVG